MEARQTMEQQPDILQKKGAGASSVQASIPQRIWKYKLHYLIVIPALLLLLLFKWIPFLNGVFLSFVDYQVFKGIWESEWVALNNFTHLFDDPVFREVFKNTIVIKGLYILLSGVITFLLALALSGIRSKLLRGFFSSLFLVPFFIPSVVFASIFIYALSPSTSPFFSTGSLILVNAGWFQPLLVCIEVLKTCGIPIVIAVAAIAAKHASASSKGSSGISYSQMNVIPAARATAAFMVLQLSTLLTTDFELLNSLLNPLVYETGATIDHYSYQAGFLMMEVSKSAAISMVQYGIQLLFTILAYIIVRGYFFKDLFHSYTSASAIQSNSNAKSAIGIATASLYAVVVILLLFMLFIYPFTGSSNTDVTNSQIGKLFTFSNTFYHVFVELFAVFIFMLITVTLAYPLTVRRLPGRRAYKLLLLLTFTMSGGQISEYMFARNLEMVNTIFPQLFFGLFNLAAVFVLKSIFNAKHAELKMQAEAAGRGELQTFFTLFIPKIWKPLLALGALHFVMLWNAYYPSLIYMANPESQSPMLQFMLLTNSGEWDAKQILRLGAWLSLPPVLLFLLFRRWLTSEVLIGSIRKL